MAVAAVAVIIVAVVVDVVVVPSFKRSSLLSR